MIVSQPPTVHSLFLNFSRLNIPCMGKIGINRAGVAIMISWDHALKCLV